MARKKLRAPDRAGPLVEHHLFEAAALIVGIVVRVDPIDMFPVVGIYDLLDFQIEPVCGLQT